jgi:hypothetical protein
MIPPDRMRANDPDAWRRVLDLYQPLVRYWCLRGGEPNTWQAFWLTAIEGCTPATLTAELQMPVAARDEHPPNAQRTGIPQARTSFGPTRLCNPPQRTGIPPDKPV